MPENKSFGDFIHDMTSLDVVTLTGNLTIRVNDLQDAQEGNPLKLSRIMQQLEGNLLKKDATVSALAATHVSIDKDTVTFVKENLSPEEAVYLDFHNETVKAAGIARAAMADGIAKLLLGSKR
ncbi:hypothetical protein GGR26_001350 [Lewinella marina]|uniref:Uncharacterized protein n=1 Tax=Neolewinella marina TaxID=438751 RepID=A0A2G0CFM1_9BACT|nr:hypothetical protein [Neolewinella marina]NJB85605.1 hypothetical protein [Neolewinella marina]PHK98710.1 hypothetical protein CGL56_09595 [Neolewinella marina]